MIKAHILIVDDDRKFAARLKDVLSAAGEIEVAHDEEGFHALFQSCRYDLVLLDLRLHEGREGMGLRVPGNCPRHWVADCKSVGNGGKVTFRYMHAKSGEYRIKTVSGAKFLYLLMLHVLSKGFRRMRCYGFLHPCSKKNHPIPATDTQDQPVHHIHFSFKR